MLALQARACRRRDKSALLGAGGADRAISFALAQARVASLPIANRAPARAAKLAEAIRFHYPRLTITSRNLREAGLKTGFGRGRPVCKPHLSGYVS